MFGVLQILNELWKNNSSNHVLLLIDRLMHAFIYALIFDVIDIVLVIVLHFPEKNVTTIYVN